MTFKDKCVEFTKWVMTQHRDEMGDVDACSIQDKAESLGLLMKEERSEPCGEACVCAEVSEPPYECFVLCKGLQP
jgi:hypothetical protein